MADFGSLLTGLEADGDKSRIEKLEHCAQIAETAERYENMVSCMKALVEEALEKKQALTNDQRNLLSVAYKNVVGTKRNAWRTLNESTTSDSEQEDVKKLAAMYKAKVEEELHTTCKEVLGYLDKLAEANALVLKEGGISEAPTNDEVEAFVQKIEKDKELNSVVESQVFFLKMKGDYYRYLCEALMASGVAKSMKYDESCETEYKAAQAWASGLPPTHPTRLGLALNLSVCYYEILEKRQEAQNLAKEAFDQAIDKLDSLNDVSYKDSTLIMQLLRDNLTIWTAEDNNVPDDEAA